MEQGMDVSWMAHGKDKLGKHQSKVRAPSPPDQEVAQASTQPLATSTPSKINGTPAPLATVTPASVDTQTAPNGTPARSIPPPKPGFTRTTSTEERKSPNANGSSPRRGSWFSKISSQFSSSPGAQPPAAASPSSLSDDEAAPLPKSSPNKNAVLAHAHKQAGDQPYVPAPPKSGQPGFLQVFRRLSSSNGALPTNGKNNHGLVERRVLNVDKQRERPRIGELNQAKLRRVAFCVDVEIAPMPKYADAESPVKQPLDDPQEKAQKRKVTEKGEGAALKRPQPTVDECEKIEEEGDEGTRQNGDTAPKPAAQKPTSDAVSKRPPPVDTTLPAHGPRVEPGAASPELPKSDGGMTRKKEKKIKSEAERKAKKEKKRQEALEKGAIPMEIHLDTDSSSDGARDEGVSMKSPAKPQILPTTNPGRIYRRCCQLRETDILTKITNQLPKTTDQTSGVVEQLDLAGYFMSLPDLVTLGDFLAVVPVKELTLESCGLSDEGVRVVLAGLMAARRPTSTRQRRSVNKPTDLVQQGGVVERLVLKNNKLTVEGWKHICLFIHMCRSIKYLDVSGIAFPPQLEQAKSPLAQQMRVSNGPNPVSVLDLSLLLSKALGERLAGPELELLNIGETGLSMNQLGAVIDGCIKSGVTRLGLGNNDINSEGYQHVARYLKARQCTGLDLGGNDLRDHAETIAEAIADDDDNFWAISLANCNLKPASLCKLLPKLAKVSNLRFIDVSHNHDLFASEQSAVGLFRRYLPKMHALKRLHLSDCAMSSEQAIALAEILPEVTTLAHINLLENPKISSLADAQTEQSLEEACAFYASIMSAARVSKALVKIDIDTPSAASSDIVKALANQTLAYCLRNMGEVSEVRDAGQKPQEGLKYPDVLRHLVGHEDDSNVEFLDEDVAPAPDEDYVIGGTALVKALSCVLNNRGDDSRRQSGEFIRDFESGNATPQAKVAAGKAKDMSKHLLASARKIRVRLQPALAQAKASSSKDTHNYMRLQFLDQTIEGIIRRFEDEFPDTREALPQVPNHASEVAPGGQPSSLEVEPVFISDNEDETELRSPISRSRSNSIMSSNSRALTSEEGRALRVGHSFRRGFIAPQSRYFELFGTGVSENDPDHIRLVKQLLEDISQDDEDVRRKVELKGPVRTFQEDKDELLKKFRDRDPEYYDRFIESQEKARANVDVDAANTPAKAALAGEKPADGSAIAD